VSRRARRLRVLAAGPVARAFLAGSLLAAMLLAPLGAFAQTGMDETLQEFDPEATGEGLFPRVVFNGQLPAGWTMLDNTSDRPEYAGFEAETPDVRVTFEGGYVIIMHNWWQDAGSTQEWVEQVAPERLQIQLDDAEGEATGNVEYRQLAGKQWGYLYFEDIVGNDTVWFRRNYRRAEYYYAFDDGSSIEIAMTGSAVDPAEFEQYWADAESVLSATTLNMEPWPETESSDDGLSYDPQGTPDGPAENPFWRTVLGGALAVAAAAAALAGAASGSATRSGEKLDPNKPVGYVLQLSAGQLALKPQESAPLTVQVHAVMPDGSTRPAREAQIALSPPEGVSVQPDTGSGTLSTLVWPTGAVPRGGTLAVHATASLGATNAQVQLSSAEETRIATRLEPEDTAGLRCDGADSLTVVASVALSTADTSGGADAAAVNASIEFSSASEWLDISEAVDYAEGRAIRVQASQPDPGRMVQPPETAPVRVSAQVGQVPLSATVAIPLARLPEIDAKPDTAEFAVDSGATVDIEVWIENGGGVEWEFDHAWAENAPVLASVAFERHTPTTATATLTEAAAGKTDPSRPETSSTLKLLASAEGFETLERHITVTVAQEGLFVDRTGADPATGAFVVKADGSGSATEIDVRVYVRDGGSGAIAADISLAQTVEYEIGGEEGTPGHAGLKAGGLVVEPAGVRQLNDPSATFRLGLERQLPTGGDALPATVMARVPGMDEPSFASAVTLRLLGVNTEPYSAAWEVELERCRYIIDEFVPAEYRLKLDTLLSERAKTMGAEGLYEMRHRLWSFAHDQLVKEAHEHLDAAWWNEQIEGVLDWISWCGDIAMGVASGAFVGTVGAVAIGMLKPILVSAVEAWVYGRSLEQWAYGQLGIFAGVVEGAATDPDLLAKLTGDKKALAWAIFIAYYFAKELYNDPDMSVTNAMKNVGRQLRDEGLIIFLRRFAGAKGGAVGDDARAKGAKPGADAPDARAKGAKPGADAPDAPRAKPTPDAPDAPRAKPTPDAPDAPRAKPTPDAPDASRAKPKPEAPAAEPTTPKPAADAPDAGARPKPEPDAGRPKSDTDTGTTKKPDADTAPDKPAAEKPADSKPDADKPAAEKPAEKPVEKPADSKPDPRRTSSKPKERANSMADDIKNGTAGGKDLDPRTAEQIMRDPDAMRELRKNHPDAWRKFHETRSKTYEAHDAKLKDWIERNVPEAAGKEVEIQSFGTPDGVDRDFRAGYTVTDPATGQQRFIEIKKESWAGESHKIFAGETGGPTDPAGAAKWSKDHQQLATDQYHAEASVDMADQATIYNEQTGRWEKTQVTPNVDLVKQGKSTLLDPDGYGKTYETKVAEAYHEGNHLDAYKQADKAVHSLEGVRDGYAMQGYGVGELPPKIEAGMQTIKDVQAGSLDPAAADAKLRGLGYSGGLPDFMERVSGQFASFKWARKA